MRRSLLAPVAALLLACACGDGSGAGPAAPTAGATTPPPRCAPGTGGFRWPADVPSELPQPPGATYQAVLRRSGITSVRFSSRTSLQDSILLVLHELPKAGYTVGRGDAEPAEADVPFGQGDLVGIYKMVVLGPCRTDWLLAIGHRAQLGGSPILPTKRPGPSSSPLPFG